LLDEFSEHNSLDYNIVCDIHRLELIKRDQNPSKVTTTLPLHSDIKSL
jgi:hypothetical protein